MCALNLRFGRKVSCGNTGGPVWFDDVGCNATLPGDLTEKCNISSKVWGVHECTERSDWACKCCASANSCNDQCVIGEWKIPTPRIQVEKFTMYVYMPTCRPLPNNKPFVRRERPLQIK